jgi:neutral ceramidase
MGEQSPLISSGTVDITPQRPLMLGGYAKRTAPFRGIADRLEANVLIVRGISSRVVIITTDLLYPGETLRSLLLEYLGLANQPEELFLAASHTHFAPMTAPSMPRLGVADASYVRYVFGQIAGLIKSLEEAGAPYDCTYHEGRADHSMNRRLVRLRLTKSGLTTGAGWGPNPDGDRDENIRMLKFSKPGGEPVAIIWNYACHPNAFHDRIQISAEYPGVVRSRLRAEFGKIPILFLQGFSGDVRPSFPGTPSGITGLARRVLLGPQFRNPAQCEWEQWSNSLADCVASIARSPDMRLEISFPMSKRVEIPTHEFSSSDGANKSLFWHLLDCGGFRVVGINAEPVVEYRRLVEKLIGAPVLTAGCLDQTHCYLPSDAMISGRGYEVDGFRGLMGFDGRFRAPLQNSIVSGLKEALS